MWLKLRSHLVWWTSWISCQHTRFLSLIFKLMWPILVLKLIRVTHYHDHIHNNNDNFWWLHLMDFKEVETEMETEREEEGGGGMAISFLYSSRLKLMFKSFFKNGPINRKMRHPNLKVKILYCYAKRIMDHQI